MTKTLVFDVPGTIPQDELKEALGQLPWWRLSKALKYRNPLDQFLCAKAYILLREGLAELYGISGDLQFGYTPSGKPLLADHEDIHFNLSHCSRCACCIIADKPVGIDVENINLDPLLVESVCSADEIETVRSAEDPAIEFTKLWTLKESFLKMTGEGLRDDMKNVLLDCGTEFNTVINKEQGYVLSSTT